MTSESFWPAALPYAVFVGAAVAVGAVIAHAPWQLSLIAALAAVAALGLAVLRVAVRPINLRAPTWVEAEEVADPRLRYARLAYYVGLATIGFLTVRPALGFTASDWIFFASLGLVVLVILVYGISTPYLIPGAVTVGVLLFALGGVLSSIHAVSPSDSTLVVVRMLYLTLVWFWLGTIVLQTRSHVDTAITAWVASAALSASGALIQFAYGDVIPGGTVAWGRMTGFTEHFNVLGGLAATAFVPALMLAIDSSRRVTRIFGTASTVLISAGLLLSGSVGGLLAASVATMVWLALRGVSIRIFLSMAALFAAALVLMSSTGSTESPSPIDRITDVTSTERLQAGTGGSVYTRLEGYSWAWSRITEQPFVGVGLDPASGVDILGPHSVHNLLLSPWFTAGILGVIGILLLIGAAVVTGVRVLKHESPRGRSSAAALLAAMVAFIQHGMGEPILYVRYGWIPAALLLALRAQHIRAWSEARRHAVVGRSAVASPVRATP